MWAAVGPRAPVRVLLCTHACVYNLPRPDPPPSPLSLHTHARTHIALATFLHSSFLFVPPESFQGHKVNASEWMEVVLSAIGGGRVLSSSDSLITVPPSLLAPALSCASRVPHHGSVLTASALNLPAIPDSLFRSFYSRLSHPSLLTPSWKGGWWRVAVHAHPLSKPLLSLGFKD